MQQQIPIEQPQQNVIQPTSSQFTNEFFNEDYFENEELDTDFLVNTKIDDVSTYDSGLLFDSKKKKKKNVLRFF